MSIRRKSTTHDLATLRLHPDGSRVQQSSVNTRRRQAVSTVIDARGNWIARDAGGKASVRTRRSISAVRKDDSKLEFIDLSGDDDEQHGTDPPDQNQSQSKGKQRARTDSETPDDEASPHEPEAGRLNTRARRRLSFMRDLSFLDPPPIAASSLEQEADLLNAAPAREPIVSLPDPAPELLKAIHHFASCHYRERGQLSNSSRDYRGMKKEKRNESQKNIHTLAASNLNRQDVDSETEHTETEVESTEEDEAESEIMDAEDSGKKGPKTKGDAYKKDMYKAFDGSALMAIGIVLQEYVAHTLSPGSRISEEPRSPKRTRTE